MQICSIRGNEWRTSRNSSLFYFVFFHFSRHKTHLPHLSFILLFTPCNIIAWPSYCWPICVYVSVCMSPTAPLCPSSLAWLLSCEERFLLVFGIRGNTSFHEEPSVYGDHSAPPTPHSSPFPYITLSATASPVFFFSAFSLHFLHRPCYPKHVTLLRSLYISLRTPYFLCIFSADLLLCHLSLQYTGPSYMSQMKSLYTFTSWPFTVEVYWVSLNWPIHQCALLYVCFLPLSCAKSRNHTEHPVISLRVPDFVELLNALYTYTNQNEGY